MRLKSLAQKESAYLYFSVKYKCDLFAPQPSKNHRAHATTAHNRIPRPQSSLRYGFGLFSGRGRFFSQTISHCACLRDAAIHCAPVVAARRPLIAVVETDTSDRRTLCSLLSTLDVDVQDFDSAESYLASRNEMLGCLISEVALPGMSGLDLLRLTRSSHEAVPVILLGEEWDVRAAVTAMREGALDFIEKPYVSITILRRVALLLDHRHLNHPKTAH